MKLEKRRAGTWIVYNESGCIVAVVGTESAGREAMREFAQDMGVRA